MNKDTRTYLDTALWSSVGDNDEPLDSLYTPDDVSPGCVEQAGVDLAKFYSLCQGAGLEEDLNENWPYDFWLTRNHHGAGFWDGDYANGDKLTEIAQAFKELHPIVGDNGLIYLEG